MHPLVRMSRVPNDSIVFSFLRPEFFPDFFLVTLSQVLQLMMFLGGFSPNLTQEDVQWYTSVTMVMQETTAISDIRNELLRNMQNQNQTIHD